MYSVSYRKQYLSNEVPMRRRWSLLSLPAHWPQRRFGAAARHSDVVDVWTLTQHQRCSTAHLNDFCYGLRNGRLSA